MVAEGSAPDPRLSGMDAAATIALCQSLAEYAEAGGLSRELMLQAGGYASQCFATNTEVLLAAGRMYRLAGELALARATLIRAGKATPEDRRTLALLGEVLRELGEAIGPAQAIEEAPDEVAPSHSNPRIQATAEGPASDPAAPASGGASPSSRRRGPSQFPTKEMPAPAPTPVDTLPNGLPLPTFDLDPVPKSKAIGALRRTISSGTRRAVAAAANMATQPILRTPAPFKVRNNSPAPFAGRSPSGGYRVAEALAPFEARPGETLPEARTTPEERTAPDARTAPEGAAAAKPDSGRSRSAESVRPKPPESGSKTSTRPPPESIRPPRSTRIKMLDPGDARGRLDRYELIGEIASGGMATVFLARRDGAGGFQRFVAIKRLHPHYAHQEQFVQMFLDEARLAAGIHHPHVVPILEVGESEAGYYLVMEFIEGDTLAGLTARALARNVILPRAVAVRIVLDALAGLHAAQQLKDGEGRLLGLVHRDCTPQNILVGVDGASRVTDFGVARAASRLAITRPQTVKGKVAYLSPEQATANELDRRSDLFTMGIVLWEVLAGRPLFLSDTDAVTISKLLSGTIPPVRQYAPDVSPELEEVCHRALQRNASRRFPTAQAMGDALEAAARHSVGGIASAAEVGRCVEMLLGSELQEQRDAIRAWVALSGHGEGPESRRPRSDVPSGVRYAMPEIPGPPRLPDATPLPSTTRSTPPPLPVEDWVTPQPAAAAPISAPPSASAAADAPAPAAATETAKEAPKPRSVAPPEPSLRERAMALLKPDLGGRSVRTLLLVALILLAGVSSPLWMKKLERLRHRAPPRRPPSAQMAAPTATAAPAAPADLPAGE
jgi:serine/threonine protein kinase